MYRKDNHRKAETGCRPGVCSVLYRPYGTTLLTMQTGWETYMDKDTPAEPSSRNT